MQKSLLVTLIVGIAGVTSVHGGYEDKGGKGEGPPKPYFFAYGVQDKKGSGFGHKEESDGKTVRGSYTVDLPDGRTQIVNYVADHKNGYQAEVTYIGEAKFPDEKKDNGGGYEGQGGGHGESHSESHDHQGHESKSQINPSGHDRPIQEHQGQSSYVHHGSEIHNNKSKEQGKQVYLQNKDTVPPQEAHGGYESHGGEKKEIDGEYDHYSHDSNSQKNPSGHDRPIQEHQGQSSYVHHGPEINNYISKEQGKHAYLQNKDTVPPQEEHGGYEGHGGEKKENDGEYDHYSHESKSQENPSGHDRPIQGHKGQSSYVHHGPEIHNHITKEQGKHVYLESKDTAPNQETHGNQKDNPEVYNQERYDGHETRKNQDQENKRHDKHATNDDENEDRVVHEDHDSRENRHGEHPKKEYDNKGHNNHGQESGNNDGHENKGEDDHSQEVENEDGEEHEHAESQGQKEHDHHGDGKHRNKNVYDLNHQENENDDHKKELHGRHSEDVQNDESDNYLNFFGPDDKEWYENDDDHFH